MAPVKHAHHTDLSPDWHQETWLQSLYLGGAELERSPMGVQPYSRFLLGQLHAEVFPKTPLSGTEWEAIGLRPAEVLELKNPLRLGPGERLEIAKNPRRKSWHA